MAVTLTPTEVRQLTGSTVTQAHIDTADQICADETTYTFDEHNTVRTIPEAMCEQAWAIASVVVSLWFPKAGDDPAITTESQGDYSYSIDQDRRTRAEGESPITPAVRRLLNIAQAAWHHV